MTLAAIVHSYQWRAKDPGLLFPALNFKLSFNLNWHMRLGIVDYGRVLLPWVLPASLALLFIAERLPMVRRDLFSKLPVIGYFYKEYEAAD